MIVVIATLVIKWPSSTACVLLSVSAAVEANNGSTTCKYIHYRSKLDSYPF